jgi:hypothetical protein
LSLLLEVEVASRELKKYAICVNIGHFKTFVVVPKIEATGHIFSYEIREVGNTLPYSFSSELSEDYLGGSRGIPKVDHLIISYIELPIDTPYYIFTASSGIGDSWDPIKMGLTPAQVGHFLAEPVSASTWDDPDPLEKLQELRKKCIEKIFVNHLKASLREGTPLDEICCTLINKLVEKGQEGEPAKIEQLTLAGFYSK